MFDFLYYPLSFILFISILVFIHEFGHYFVARRFGVRVIEFSIGFGKELISRVDKNGTKWKICAIPMGGFVKMFGDANEGSQASSFVYNLSEAEKSETFHFKKLYQKFLIVLAGPLINIIFAVIIFIYLASVNGKVYVQPEVTYVQENSGAEIAGVKKGDIILAVNGKKISDFQEIKLIINLAQSKNVFLTIKRGEEIVQKDVIAFKKLQKDFLGNEAEMFLLGIGADKIVKKDLSFSQACISAIGDSISISKTTLIALGQIITGKRSLLDLSGPLRIAKYSGDITKKVVQDGDYNISLIMWFMAIISLNLGIFNLLPIPLLDGGHLFFYLIEMVKGSAVSFKVQTIFFRLGIVILFLMMSIAITGDILSIFGK